MYRRNQQETYRDSEGNRGTSIELRCGTEGPRHDPYGYKEITVTRSDGREATLHSGLAEWMTYNDGRVTRRFEDPIDILWSKFEACVGISPELAERAFHRVKENRIRHHACGMKHLNEVSGYPGETFLMCEKCKAILDSSFNESAII